MKFSVSCALFSVLLAPSLVSASPLLARQTSQTQGAVYFITNEPTGNTIVAASIANDGTLTLRTAIPAVGNGAHGITDPIGPDPLFSQGAIKASNKAAVLATVNAGSNTVSLFKINPEDPVQFDLLGFPTSSGGEFPISLAFDKDGNHLCVLNSGQINGVKCFKVDQQEGLIPLQDTARSLNLNQTTPATGPQNTASHIIFTEDGSKLLASVKGNPEQPDVQPGFIASWDVITSQDSFTLSENFETMALPQGGLLPFSMTVLPGQNALLATDAAIGFDLIDLEDNSRSTATEIPGQGATCWSNFSPKTQTLFLTDIMTNLVTEVSVDDNLSGEILNQYPLTNGSSTIDNEVVSMPQNDFLYVLSPGNLALDAFALDAPGNARNIQSLEFGQAAQAAGLTVDTNNLQGLTSFVKPF